MTVEIVEPAGRPTLLIRYRANSAPDAVTGKQVRLEVDRYEFFKNGQLAALSLSAPAGSDNVDAWNQISPGASLGLAPPLEAHDLYRFYHIGDDETLALRGVSCVVEPGEIVAVTGPSGSGKSTLFHCVAGLDEPDGGWVRISGERMTRRPEAERANLRARRIGILLQAGNLLEHLTLRENQDLAQRLAGCQGSARRRRNPQPSRAGGAGRRASRAPFGGRTRPRAGLALALVNDPPILLADEPTGEVDALLNEAHILELLVGRADRGGATLVVTHSAAVAAAAHRVIHLIDGRLDGP